MFVPFDHMSLNTNYLLIPGDCMRSALAQGIQRGMFGLFGDPDVQLQPHLSQLTLVLGQSEAPENVEGAALA